MDNARRDQIEAAISELDLIPDVDIEREAGQIDLRCSLLLMNRLPRAQKTRKQDGRKKELAELALLAGKLSQTIQALHGDTLALLATKPIENPLFISKDCFKLANACADLANAEPPQDKTLGQPSKNTEAKIASLCKNVFERLTGGKAAVYTTTETSPQGGGIAYGPFLEFVGAIYKAYDLAASPESQARAATRK